MLICTTTLVGLTLILIALNNLLPENVKLQTYIRSAFSVALGAGMIIGLVAYWLRLEPFSATFRLNWLNFGQTNLVLSFKIDTLGAYLVGFSSLYVLLVTSLWPSLLSASNFNRLAGFYALSILMVLAGDVITLQVAWLWSLALMAMSFRSDEHPQAFPPLLGGILLFLGIVLLIIFTRQTTIPDQSLVTSLPQTVISVIGSLILATVLIQACQFPFPLWMTTTWPADYAGGQLALGAGSVTLSSVLLIWKFYYLLQPVQLFILAGCGLLTLLLVFYRIHQKATPIGTQLWLLLTGGLGFGLISLLVKNSPFVFLMVSLLPIRLVLIELTSAALRDAEESVKANIGSKIGRWLLLLIITGAPLTISYNLELSLLDQFIQRQLYFPVTWLGLALLSIGYIAWIGVVIRVAFPTKPETGRLAATTPPRVNRWPKAATIVSGLMLLYTFYPLPLTDLFTPNSVSNFFELGSMAGPSELRDSTYLWKVNLLLTGFWLIVATSFVLLRRQLVFSSTIKIGRSWFYQQLFRRGPDYLASQTIRVLEKCSQWSTKFARRVAGVFRWTLTAIDNAPESLSTTTKATKELSQTIVNKSARRGWLWWLIAGLVLLILVVLLIIILK